MRESLPLHAQLCNQLREIIHDRNQPGCGVDIALLVEPSAILFPCRLAVMPPVVFLLAALVLKTRLRDRSRHGPRDMGIEVPDLPQDF